MLNRVSGSLQPLLRGKKLCRSLCFSADNCKQNTTASLKFTWPGNILQEMGLCKTQPPQKRLKKRRGEIYLFSEYFTLLQRAIMEITLLTAETESPLDNYFWTFLVLAGIDRLWRVAAFAHVEPQWFHFAFWFSENTKLSVIISVSTPFGRQVVYGVLKLRHKIQVTLVKDCPDFFPGSWFLHIILGSQIICNLNFYSWLLDSSRFVLHGYSHRITE